MAQRQQSPGEVSSSPRRWAPPPALAGFLVLLVVVFAVSYRVGSLAGPVAPGMRSTGTGPGPEDGGGSDRNGHGGTGGMHSGGGR